MASIVSICNLALGHLGADKIDSLSEASAEARACNRFYSQTLDNLLASGPAWRFARYEATLAEIDGETSARWAHIYAIPADLLRVRSIAPPASAYQGVFMPGDLPEVEGSAYPFELFGMRLLCNLSPVSLRYIRRIDDPNQFPPLFIEALSWHLATRLAMPITRDTNQREGAFQMAQRAQAAAAAADANDERNTSSFVSEYEACRE